METGMEGFSLAEEPELAVSLRGSRALRRARRMKCHDSYGSSYSCTSMFRFSGLSPECTGMLRGRARPESHLPGPVAIGGRARGGAGVRAGWRVGDLA